MYPHFSVLIILSIRTDIFSFALFALELPYHLPFILSYAVEYICCLESQMIYEVRSHLICVHTSFLLHSYHSSIS